MSSKPTATAPRTTADFRVEAKIRGQLRPYLRYRDDGRFAIVALDEAEAPIYIGRHPSSGIQISADLRVSGRHARMLYGAGCWSIEDAGSRNGTIVNGRPITAELRLTDGAMVEIGSTKLSFHDPGGRVQSTIAGDSEFIRHVLRPTPTQRRVLVELVRPWFAGDVVAPVAPTNKEIAAGLCYQPATVRDAISDLYRQAGLARGDSDQRQALVELVIRARIVTPADFV